MKNTLDYWQFEDDMDKAGIFINGLRGTTCHRESYMTVMEYDKMEAFLKAVRGKYSLAEWFLLIKHFDSIAYLSPMNGLVAREMERAIKV